MKKLIVVVCCLFLVIQGRSEVNRMEHFHVGNALYQAGDYDSAIYHYNKVLTDSITAFNVFYNLGNANFKSGRIGQAILNFEKAKVINPNDEDVNFNIKIANLSIKDKIEPLPETIFQKIWSGLTSLASVKGWSFLLIISFWLALIGWGIYLFANTLILQKIGFFLFLTTLFIGLIALLFGWGKHSQDKKERYAIITAPSAIIKSEPSENATDLYILHEGLKLRVNEKVSFWNKVTHPDGNVGWLISDRIEEI